MKLGFLNFAASSQPGPLFYPPYRGTRKADPAQTVSGRISNWLKAKGVIPSSVSPNHGWRHAFKTAGLEVGIDARVLDAIQGHAARTAGESYGDVTLLAKKRAIDKLPEFDISEVFDVPSDASSLPVAEQIQRQSSVMSDSVRRSANCQNANS